MTAVERARGTMGTAAACDALGVARATVYRRRAPARPPAPRPTPPRALAPVERQRVLETKIDQELSEIDLATSRDPKSTTG